jgi:transcriptional regulator
MYNPDHFREDDPARLMAVMRDIQLAALVSTIDSELVITHAPVLVRQDGDELTLDSHFARANDHWRRLADGAPTVAIFQGPHGYISPSWYPTKQENGKVVPTWNYITVHAHGTLVAMKDQAWLRGQVEALTATNEQNRDEPWAVSDAPERYTEIRLRGIVGVQLRVERLEGKWKASQNKADVDRAGAAAGTLGEAQPAPVI